MQSGTTQQVIRINNSLTTSLFAHQNFYVLTSDTSIAETAAAIVNSPKRSSIYLYSLTDADYDTYYNNLIEDLGVTLVGIQNVSRRVVESFFDHLNRAALDVNRAFKPELLKLGLDGLDDEALTVIQKYLILYHMKKIHVKVICGENIPHIWHTRFSLLNDPDIIKAKSINLLSYFLLDHLIHVNRVGDLNNQIQQLETDLETTKNLDKNMLACLSESQINAKAEIEEWKNKFIKAYDQMQSLTNESKKLSDKAQDESKKLMTDIKSLSSENDQLKAELSSLKIALLKSQENEIKITAERDTLAYRLQVAENTLSETENQLSGKTIELIEFTDKFTHLNLQNATVLNSIKELKSTNLFEETDETNSAEDLPDNNQPSKKRKLPAVVLASEVEEKEVADPHAAENLTAANYLFMMMQAEQNGDEVTDEEGSLINDDLQNIPLRIRVQMSLLKSLGKLPSLDLPDADLETYILQQLSLMDEIFKEGKGWHEITGKRISAVILYLCHILCRRPKSQEITAELSNSKFRLEIFMNMVDALKEASETNISLKLGNIDSDAKLKKLQTKLQTLQEKVYSNNRSEHSNLTDSEYNSLQMQLANAKLTINNLNTQILNQGYVLNNAYGLITFIQSQTYFHSSELTFAIRQVNSDILNTGLVLNGMVPTSTMLNQPISDSRVPTEIASATIVNRSAFFTSAPNQFDNRFTSAPGQFNTSQPLPTPAQVLHS
jgi:hypothetical protein